MAARPRVQFPVPGPLLGLLCLREHRLSHPAATAVRASGDYIPGSAISLAVAIIGVFCVLALAYVGMGIWNIAARRSTAKSPLIAAIVLAAAAFVLIFVSLATMSTGGSRSVGSD